MREDLKAVGVEIVEEDGLGRLSMREAALRAGYSAAAPYQVSFFREHKVRGLYAVVAEAGFEKLLSALQAVDRPEDGGAYVRDLAACYATFAWRNPELYRVMFHPQIAHKADFPGLSSTIGRAYALMREALASGSLFPAAELDDATLALAMLLHGWADQLINEWIVGPIDEEYVTAKTADYVRLLIS